MIAVTVLSWLVLAGFVVLFWPRINTRRRWRVTALGFALAFSLAHQSLYATVVRQAFVTFRYASNAADGHGFVYNPGEHVEGYTNFLWLVLLVVPAHVFGQDGLVTTAVVFGAGCTLASVFTTHVLARDIVCRARPSGPAMPAVGVAAAGLTAGASSLAAYGFSGLETPLFVLLVLLTCLALSSRRPVVAGVLAALSIMTSPDGIVVALVAVGWLVVEAVRGRADPWSPASAVLGALVLLVPWTAWRVTVYGHWIPTAVMARSGGSLTERLARGGDYVAEFALGYQALLLLAIAAAALLLHRRRVDPDVASARSLIGLLFALAVVFAMVVAVLGGDWLPAWRLLAPVPPLLAVAATAAYGVVALTSPTDAAKEPVAPVPVSGGGTPPGTTSAQDPRPPRAAAIPLVRRRTAPVAALAVCGLSILVTVMHPRALTAMRQLDHVTAGLARVGSFLGETLPRGTVVSTHAPGVLAYRAAPDLVVVDVFGRTDEHIGRDAQSRGFVGGRFVAHDYDYVVNARTPSVAVEAPAYTTEQRCGINPAYAPRYEVASFRHLGTSHWVGLYLRRALSAELIEMLEEHPEFEYVSCA